MKIFLDTAKIEEIRAAMQTGLIDGVTTNPTLILRSGRSDAKQAIREICDLVAPRPVSAEVISQDTSGMVSEARKLAKIAPNIVVKIPITQAGVAAVRKLYGRRIQTNVTLVFSANQALLAAKAGADYVSPFVGRLDDQGARGMDVVRDIIAVFKNYDFKTKVIVASVRNAEHIKEADLLGADIATLPFKTWQEMFLHPLTDEGIKKFLEDWRQANASL